MYLALGIVGILVLVVGLVMDGVLDFLDDSILPASGVALTIFGATGLISSSLDVGDPSQLFWTSFITSSIVTIFFVVLWKMLKRKNRAEDILEIKLDSILGTTGEIVAWGKSSGDAIFEYLGSHRKLHVVSEKTLEYGDKVVAVEHKDNNVFVVEKVE